MPFLSKVEKRKEKRTSSTVFTNLLKSIKRPFDKIVSRYFVKPTNFVFGDRSSLRFLVLLYFILIVIGISFNYELIIPLRHESKILRRNQYEIIVSSVDDVSFYPQKRVEQKG